MQRRPILVGVHHRDRRLLARLEALLFHARPERVVLEMSPASLAYRRGAGRARVKALRALLAETDPASARARDARDLLSVLALPVECKAALRYARESLGGARLVFADRSIEAVPHLEELDAWAEEATERLTLGQDPVEWRPAPPALLPADPEAAAHARRREARLARVIRRAVAAVDGARVVALGGIDHLAPLAALLSDLDPIVRAMAAPSRRAPLGGAAPREGATPDLVRPSAPCAR